MSSKNPEVSRKWHRENRQRDYVTRKERIKKLKVEVLTYYGNGKLACVRCGISDVDVLCIDHVDGNAGGRKRERTGYLFHYRLRKLEFPKGYQTLCANCNLKKAFERKELCH